MAASMLYLAFGDRELGNKEFVEFRFGIEDGLNRGS